MTIEPAQPFDYKTPRLQPLKRLFGNCAIEGCKFPHKHGIPLCEEHAYDVWSQVNEWTENAMAEAKAEDARREWNKQWADKVFERMDASRTNQTTPGTIYYLQVEDKVKIGFTRDLRNRLKAYPPMSKLLATHPGTFQLEAEMHRKFKDHIAGGREWFDENDELTAHIAHVRTQFKQDRLVAA